MRRSNNSRSRVFSSSCSSSSSSSRSYSPSGSSPSGLLPQTPRRTMEEVWADLSFPSPPPHPPLNLHHQNPTPCSFRGVILQDFLAGPLKEKTPPAPDNPAAPQLPPTALSLNSGLDFEYNSAASAAAAAAHGSCRREDGGSALFVPPPAFADAIMGGSPPAIGAFAFCPPSDGRLLPGSSCGGFEGDRRHKRMMKNRESAARSRARKQAYTNELELEVAHLVAENGKLKKQCEKLQMVIAAQGSTKKILQRTSTAPF